MTNTTNNKTNTTTPATAANVNFRAPINFKVCMPVNFHAPVTVNLTYNGAAEEKVTATDLQRYICEQTAGQCETVNPRVPTSEPAKCNLPTDKPPYKYDTKKGTGCGVAEVPIDDQIKDAIVREFGFPRDKIVSVTPFKSCYDHYAVGTTGDVTFVAWRHQDGYIHVRKQTW